MPFVFGAIFSMSFSWNTSFYKQKKKKKQKEDIFNKKQKMAININICDCYCSDLSNPNLKINQHLRYNITVIAFYCNLHNKQCVLQ